MSEVKCYIKVDPEKFTGSKEDMFIVSTVKNESMVTGWLCKEYSLTELMCEFLEVTNNDHSQSCDSSGRHIYEEYNSDKQLSTLEVLEEFLTSKGIKQ